MDAASPLGHREFVDEGNAVEIDNAAPQGARICIEVLSQTLAGFMNKASEFWVIELA